MPVLLILFIPFLFVPISTAYFAQSLNRSFWLWMALGTFFPFISFAVLWFLPEQKKELGSAA